MRIPSDPPEQDNEPTGPAAFLRAELDELYDDYLTRWGPEEEHQLFRDIAEAFKPSVDSLVITQELIDRIRVLHEEVGTPARLDDIAGFVQDLTEHPIVRDGIELRLAYTALANLSGAQTRLADVLRLIGPRSLTDRVEEYLRRAVNLYLWGLEQEAVVMCAATLEAAYQSQLTEIRMSALEYAKDDYGSFRGPQYEEAAFRLNIFTTAQREMAGKFRRARNQFVHTKPTVNLSAREVLAGTAELLTCLFSADLT